jgi:hypothetical protein
VKRVLITLAILPFFDSSALASGSLSDVQLDNVCNGSAGCCPSAQCNRNQLTVVTQVNRSSPTDNNRSNLTGAAQNSTPTGYTILTGQAAVSAVQSVMGAK